MRFSRLRRVLDLEHEALAERGERALELGERRGVIEVKQPAHLARVAAEALRQRGLGQPWRRIAS